MQEQQASQAFAAFANPIRLGIFRKLIAAGADGLAAGVLAVDLDLLPSKLSFHLRQLQQVGLLRSWRVQRHIYYAVDLQRVRELLNYLTQTCCQGQLAVCADVSNVTKFC